ncbi:MAG: ABC transporter ATP-binding protein, partial [Candidatus Aenigmatarchaeota archaeon]
MKKILEVKNLSVELRESRKRIMEDVSFKVEEGSIYVLIGPNGAGKSTLAYTLMGIPRFKVISGKIIFRNRDITYLPTAKRAKLGMSLAFQEPARFEGIKVEDFLKAGNRNISARELEEILSMLNLSPEKFLSREISTLSGGERKRVELASLVALKPILMILDEPDAG